MKKMLALAVVIVMLFAGASACADSLLEPSATDLTMDAAVAVAQEEAARLLGLSYDEMGGFEHTAHLVIRDVPASGARVWIVSFFGEDYIDPASAIVVESPAGEIVDATTQPFFEIYEAWYADKGSVHFWSIEDQAIFDMLFLSPSRLPQNTLPSAEQLTQEAALQIARETICAQFAVQEDALDALRVSCSFKSGIPDLSIPGDDVWIVSFRPQQPDENGEYANLYQVNLSATYGRVYLVHSDALEGQW